MHNRSSSVAIGNSFLSLKHQSRICLLLQWLKFILKIEAQTTRSDRGEMLLLLYRISFTGPLDPYYYEIPCKSMIELLMAWQMRV